VSALGAVAISLRSENHQSIPVRTVRTARAACPNGTTATLTGDRSDVLSEDDESAGLYPADGRPGPSPDQLALVSVLQFASMVVGTPKGTREALNATGSIHTALQLAGDGADMLLLEPALFRSDTVTDRCPCQHATSFARDGAFPRGGAVPRLRERMGTTRCRVVHVVCPSERTTTVDSGVPFLVTVTVSPRAAAARICEDFWLNSRAVVSMSYVSLQRGWPGA
jgi:hypothetical protein